MKVKETNQALENNSKTVRCKEPRGGGGGGYMPKRIH